VLIVPPFGWEDVASYRARRMWAERLAAAGSPALRLDLPGTGDSAGGPRDPGRVAAWIDATAAAAAWLRAQAPDRRLVAVGLGLGGALAWAAAAAGAAVDDLVLWGVPARGRTLVRELRAFAALKNDEWGDSAPPPDAPALDGFDVAGYVMATETADALSALDLTALPLANAGARRVLLLGRDGVPADGRLRAHAEDAGVALEVDDGPGWGAMTSGPQEFEPPAAVFDRVDAWLAAAAPGPLAPAPAPPRADEELVLPGLVEQPWLAERDFGRQFGVLARPAEAPAPGLGVVLLNAGAVRHTGPNRMWVEVARRWAAQGVPVLRLDIEGLGDSDGTRDYRDSARLYDPAVATRAVLAVEELAAAGVAGRWLLAGVCAGASWAFHAAADGGAPVAAAVMVNPFAFYWEDELVVERDLSATRRLRGAQGWKRLLSGEVSGERMVRTAAHMLRTPVELRARRRRAAARVGRERRDLERLAERGVHLTLLIGRDEPISERFARSGLLASLERDPNVTLRALPSRDHTFRAPWQQAHVHAELDAAIASALDRAGP
jgi:alpha-beta hydrolase superfamily lysophospholipase